MARKKDRSDRNKVEKKVKGFGETGSFDSLVEEVKEDMKEVLEMNEDVIGMMFRHMWEVDDEDVEFIGDLSCEDKGKTCNPVFTGRTGASV